VARAKTRTRRFGIGVAIVIGAVIALNLAAGGIDRAVGGSEPSGVAGSSYGTQATGLGGLATLFTHYEYPVDRARGAVVDANLDTSGTVFVIDPQTLTENDDAALLQFASAGGRLVIGGPDPFYLHRLRDRPPTWSPTGVPVYTEVAPELGNVRQIYTSASGSWSRTGSGQALVRSGGNVLLTKDDVGSGAILFLADTSPLENAYLAQADNAAFALGLAGASPRPVEFIEGVHGYGARRGLGALPAGWKIAFVIFAAAAIAIAWSRSRRFGPPDRPERELLPARAEYVRALAVSLERTRDPAHALAPLQVWARTRVAQRAHLGPDATLEEIDRAAIALGYSEAERAALWHPPTDDGTALALGELVSRLSQHDGRTP